MEGDFISDLRAKSPEGGARRLLGRIDLAGYNRIRAGGAPARAEMADSKQVENIAERVINEVLGRHLPEIRQETVRQVLAALPQGGNSESGSSSAMLEAALAAVQQVTSQADILSVLLDSAVRFSGRVALFVVRGDSATLWQARGFPDDTALRNFNLNLGGPVVVRALQEKVPVAAGLDFDPAFLAKVGHPTAGNAILMPFTLREKVSALVYADCGLQASKLDVAALKLLIRSASIWLEVLSLRKAAGISVAESPIPAPAQSSTSVQPPAPVPVSEPRPFAAPPPEDSEVHTRAQRFAKLLVDEIKLYNEAKVLEGRKQGDLYERLREDIEKSRASYDKRYGATPAAEADYFNKELVRVLADNEPALLGANFPA